ncbi:MAG: hypothetical protein JNL71_03005 [Rhodospirillales bacterium]|nr:hypothetical protein [Rhodospirillales bacterium]
MSAAIDLRLHTVRQLFQSFDPAPFHDKDLDPDAVAYIVARAREHPAETPLAMTVEIPAEQAHDAEATGLPEAIRGYFEWREEMAWRDMRDRLAEGRQALVVGIAFLVACGIARELLAHLTGGPWFGWIGEGLTIVGWIAMWHPVDIFLYRWWPIRREALLHRRLASMDVRVLTRPPSGA